MYCTKFKTLNYPVSEYEHTEGQMQRDDIGTGTVDVKIIKCITLQADTSYSIDIFCVFMDLTGVTNQGRIKKLVNI